MSSAGYNYIRHYSRALERFLALQDNEMTAELRSSIFVHTLTTIGLHMIVLEITGFININASLLSLQVN